MTQKEDIKVAFVGMTHLGLIHAVAFAEKGFTVYAYDDSATVIENLNQGVMPVNEPQLDDLVLRNKDSLYFTANPQDLQVCDVVFIAYDVPTDSDGNSDLKIVKQFVDKVNQVIRSDASLVILSQVPPGFTRAIQRDKNNLFYQVETLIFGRAIERALFPERYMVGMSNAAHALPSAYEYVLSAFNCPILKMKYESAELAKISINMFLVASVTTTNTIAELCERLGADWDEIAPSLRLDKRIGAHAYLTPGLGIAGGNLERDLNTFIKMGTHHETDVEMVKSWVENSKYRKNWVYQCLQENVLNHLVKPRIAILGLAYKPNTHSVKNSPSLLLIEQLKNYEIHAHDPIVHQSHGTHIQLHASIDEAIQNADVVIVMIPSNEYKQLDIHDIQSRMKGQFIIDPHQTLKHAKSLNQNVHYYCLGKPAMAIKDKDVEYA